MPFAAIFDEMPMPYATALQEAPGPYYAGVGSRETPEDVLAWMRRAGRILALKGYTLRSGGAPGADTAFEKGCDEVQGRKTIFLGWKGFNGHTSPFVEASPEAYAMAEAFHPGWAHLTRGPRSLMARNSHQIMGLDMKTPVGFVLCYTPDGCLRNEDRRTKTKTRAGTGGTGQAIGIASAHNIPVYNLQRPEHRLRVETLLDQWEMELVAAGVIAQAQPSRARGPRP